MNDKVKNIVSNILGLAVFVFSIYSLVYNDLEVTTFAILSAIGLALFLFKASKSSDFLSKFISKKIED